MKYLTLLALAIGAAAHAAPPPVRPKLIVAIAVDQYSQTLHDRYRGTYRDGLKRLDAGIAFNGYQSHAATETCPGHSTILTGRHPAATGIVANNWIDRASGKSVYCVSVPGANPAERGPQNLKADTLGDWLKRTKPGARVFSVSGKDRAAIMLGGHQADGIWWWQDGKGFVNSVASGATVGGTAQARAFDDDVAARWRRARPVLWPAPTAACRSLERAHRFGEEDVSGRVPPELALKAVEGDDFAGSKLFQEQLHSAPLYDRLVLDFAGKIIDEEHIGHGPATDLLALSFSATDYVGHRFGGGGAEMCVQLGALDRLIGDLMRKLDRLHVPYAVVLTADHGGTDAAERLVETIPEASRIDARAIVADLNALLRRDFGLPTDPLIFDDPGELYLVSSLGSERTHVRDAAMRWLKGRPEVVTVFDADMVAAARPRPGTPPADLSFAERFHESYDPVRSGDILIAYRRYGSFYQPRKPGDYVAGHGSVWDEDRRVPILFWWRGAKAMRPATPIETVDIAPTLATIAGIAVPAVDGHCLTEVTPSCPK